jgi:DHA1 family multidrug resistance protein-like MFS transporter
VWLANLLTGIGMMSFLPFFPSYIEHLGVEDRDEVAAWAGLCFGAAPFSAALMGPVWGALGDRIGRKLMVLRSLLALTLFVGLMAFARTPLELLVLRVLQGLFSGIIPPSITLVSIGVPPDRRGRVAGGMQAAMSAGAIFGPLIGSFVRADFDPRYLFVGVSVATAVGALLVALFATEDASERKVGTADGRLLHALVRDLADLWRVPRLRALLLLLFCVQFGLGATNPVLELFVRDLVPEASPERLTHLTGILYSVLNVLLVVAAPVWGPIGDRVGHARALLAASAIGAAALVGSGLATTFAVLVAARVLLGAGVAGLGPTSFGLAAESVPPDARGAANGAVFSARALALATSAMVGGFLSSVLGIRGLFLTAGVLLALGLALGARRLQRRAERAPAPAPAPAQATPLGGASEEA